MEPFGIPAAVLWEFQLPTSLPPNILEKANSYFLFYGWGWNTRRGRKWIPLSLKREEFFKRILKKNFENASIHLIFWCVLKFQTFQFTGGVFLVASPSYNHKSDLWSNFRNSRCSQRLTQLCGGRILHTKRSLHRNCVKALISDCRNEVGVFNLSGMPTMCFLIWK